ncbi:MAGa3780 family membrane protein [Mycoplasma sp. T193]|uniref:MAGa3780 family membrane protein n=1 Tax=Mycoplasma sp. T193 TaxID=3401666 RepID=UPI003AAA2A60
MKNKRIRNYFSRLFGAFKWQDWLTCAIGFTLIVTYITITILEWHFRSLWVLEAYNITGPGGHTILDDMKEIYDSSDQNAQRVITELVYPNATYLFWGGSTYWFTFMSNVLMGVTLFIYPFYQKSRRAQTFYFASMVYIIIVMLGYWGGVIFDNSIITQNRPFEMIKTLIMHAGAPFLGLFTLFAYERKRVRISTRSIWGFAAWPIAYLLFTVAIYFIGYKFMKPFGGTELQRGVTIYGVVSFYHPIGYTGDSLFVVVVLDVVMVLCAIFTAPVIGFTLRKVLRILLPGQRKRRKVYFIRPESREAIAKHKAEIKQAKLDKKNQKLLAASTIETKNAALLEQNNNQDQTN